VLDRIAAQSNFSQRTAMSLEQSKQCVSRGVVAAGLLMAALPSTAAGAFLGV